MKYVYKIGLLLLLIVFSVKASFAQLDSPIVKVAVFTPMYLEDAFSGSSYKLGRSSLPKNLMPGLEFYNGVMMAADSLRLEGVKAQISIYDSKQDAASLSALMKSPELANIGLIIAAITNTTELKLFSDHALSRNIPFVSATYPNYVGIRQNPFFVLLNSSFTAHLEGLYKYMVRNYSLDNIIAVYRAGKTEEYIQKTINRYNANNTTLPVKLKWVQVKDDFSPSDLLPYLDSTKNNVFLVASPFEEFGENVVSALGNFSSYTATVIGMPTWDGIKSFNKRDNSNVTIIYSTPFHYAGNGPLYGQIRRNYKSKFYSRPSDMVFKGYETTYHFTRLLAKHRSNLVNNLSDTNYTLFNNFDIQPIKLSGTSIKPDFLENRKFYFVKKQEGTVVSVY